MPEQAPCHYHDSPAAMKKTAAESCVAHRNPNDHWTGTTHFGSGLLGEDRPREASS